MAAKWETVRVFISSTFRDMHSERDWLVKRVFPALRERLEKYRVHLIDIDLRWGVTEQQAESGGALDVCLDQIDECRPFFLGILGERYGFVSKELLERIRSKSKYDSLQRASGKSITELEILYGVLKDPEMYDHAFFCFRDPAFIKDVPPEKQKSDVLAEDAKSAEKLRALKSAIERTPLPTPSLRNYPCRYAGLKINWRLAKLELKGKDADLEVLDKVAHDGLVDRGEYDSLNKDQRDLVNRFATVQLSGLEAFGEHVKDWLWSSIRRQLNLQEEPPTASLRGTDALAEEQDFHERFMESRLRVHVGRKGFRNKLAEHADSDQTRVCLVTGSSGSGKTTALARFVLVYQRARRHITVVSHFIGASPDSTSLRLMLRRLCLTLQQAFGFAEEVEQDPQRLIGQFKEFLGRVPADRRVLIVLDALNQLDDTDRAHQLHWLPWEIPAHVKVIVSCIDDPGRDEPLLKELRKRKHEELRIEALTDDERLKIVRAVPSLSAKTLDDRQVRLLLDNKPATQNPLFLLVALEELRGFGSFEQLNARIQDFPKDGDTVTALFVQVIQRLETEFGTDLTRDVLTLLASARRGLSERELQDLTKSNDDSDDLFGILRQLRPYLQPRGELLDFFHRNLFKAVRAKYLRDRNSRKAVHVRLGNHFAGQEYFLESLEQQQQRAQCRPATPRLVNIRKIDELLWQHLRTGSATACEKLLINLNYLEARNEAGMVFELADDFTTVVNALPKERMTRPLLQFVDEALRRNIHFIDRHHGDYPQGLFQCLYNAIASEIASGNDADKLVEEGSHLVTQWHRQRLQQFPEFDWVRCAIPALTPYGTGFRWRVPGHHHGAVRQLAISLDGTRLVTAGEDGVIAVWDAQSGQVLHSITTPKSVTALAISHSGQCVASASGHELQVWSIHSGALLREADLAQVTEVVNSLDFSNDDKLLLVAGRGAILWNIDLNSLSGACYFSEINQTTLLRCALFSGDDADHTFLACPFDGLPRLLREKLSPSDESGTRRVPISTAVVQEFPGGFFCMSAGMAYAPSSKIVAITSSPSFKLPKSPLANQSPLVQQAAQSRPVHFLKLDTGVVHTPPFLESRNVNMISISADGDVITLSSWDDPVEVWRASTQEKLLSLEPETTVTCLSLSPDGKTIAFGGLDGEVRVWTVPDSASQVRTRVHRFSRDLEEPNWIITESGQGVLIGLPKRLDVPQTALLVWDRGQVEPILRMELETLGLRRPAVRNTLNGRMFLHGYVAQQQKHWLMPLEEGWGRTFFLIHPDAELEFGVSSDAALVAVGFSSGIVCVWETNGGQCLSSWDGRDTRAIIRRISVPPRAIGLFPGYDRACVHTDYQLGSRQAGELHIHELSSGRSLARLGTIDTPVTAVSLAEGVGVLAYGYSDGVVAINDVELLDAIRKFRVAESEIVKLQFSEDYQLLAAVDSAGNVRVWSWLLRRLECELAGEVDLTDLLAAISDQSLLMMHGRGESVIVDTARREPIAWCAGQLPKFLPQTHGGDFWDDRVSLEGNLKAAQESHQCYPKLREMTLAEVQYLMSFEMSILLATPDSAPSPEQIFLKTPQHI